jgi:hypothetical protein
MISTDTIKLLKDAKSKVITNATIAKTHNDMSGKIKWESRRIYIEKQLAKFEGLRNNTMIPKTVFISYSKKSGIKYFSLVKKLLEEKGFEVMDGFRKPGERNESNVLKRVIQRIKNSSVYLGILTKDIKSIDPVTKTNMWSPSVWTMEEKGMAIGLEKPFVLAIHNQIHESYWSKTSGSKQHIIFNSQTDFMSSEAFNIVDEVIDQFEEVSLRFIHNTEF